MFDHPDAHPPAIPPGEDELPCDARANGESELHRRQKGLLLESLELAWAGRMDFYAGANMGLYFSVDQARNQEFGGPDLFVALDTVRRVRKSWVVWEEEGRTPAVVIELVSDMSREADRGQRMKLYATRLRVPEYFLFDPSTGALEGYELWGSRYRQVQPGVGGSVPSLALELWLGVRDGTFQGVQARWLRWLDAAGQPLPTKDELLAAKDAALVAMESALAKALSGQEAALAGRGVGRP